MCRSLSDGLSADPAHPTETRSLCPDDRPFIPALQSSRTMGSLVLEESRGMARERGGSGSLIRTRR